METEAQIEKKKKKEFYKYKPVIERLALRIVT